MILPLYMRPVRLDFGWNVVWLSIDSTRVNDPTLSTNQFGSFAATFRLERLYKSPQGTEIFKKC